MPTYHFDLGNSNEGPIGMCAEIDAKSPEEALDILRGAMESYQDEPLDIVPLPEGVGHLSVWMSPFNVSCSDIDWTEPEDVEEYNRRNAEGEVKI